jgi:hypothetical protein
LADQFEESEARFCHHLFTEAGKIFYYDWNDFALHGRIAFEDVNCIDKYVTLLHRIFFSQQNFDALLFAEVLCDAQALNFFRRLHKRSCENLSSVSEVQI